MIDWVDFVAPLRHEFGLGSPFYNGEVMSTKANGELDWGVFKRMSFEGSHSANIQVRSAQMDDGRQAIRVSGNLVKWFQGHNVFGTNNLRGLVLDSLAQILHIGKIVPDASDVEAWKIGDIDLLRVDDTDSFQFGTLPRVLNALRSLDATANLKFRGRGSYNGHSLLFGKGSRHWSLTFYAKGAELDKHKLPLALASTPLREHADGLLRTELRLLSMHLKRIGMDKLSAWGENTAIEVHRKHLEQLSISDSIMLDPDNLEQLTPRLRAAYQLWRDGHDLRAMFPRNTFYRYRTELVKLGIDIAVKQDREETNVIPIRTVLVGQRVNVPDWALNTSMYFEPRIAAFG
jgi:II/X family phage/plasmid replication protein